MTSENNNMTLASSFKRPVPDSIDELRQIKGAIPDDFPDSVAKSLLEFARSNNFEISHARREVSTLFFKGDKKYLHFVTPTALKRKAMATGLWLPGEISFEGSGFDLVAFANSWIRFSQTDEWVKGAMVTVPFMDYYDRTPNSSQPKPLWQLTPHSRLATVAECRAIYAALGDLVNNYLVIETWNALESDVNVAALMKGEMSYAEYCRLRHR